MVTLETALPRVLAAVRREVRIGQVGRAFGPALDLVWAHLRTNSGMKTDGHNVCVYHHPARRSDPMEVDFGVEMAQAFPDAGDVRCTRTPAGEIATATHVGPYHLLNDTHEAIHAWVASNGRTIGGKSWEIYGDHDDDPSRLETRICYLVM